MELDTTSARPDFAVLVYPVITMKDPYVHAGSRKSLLGATPAPEMVERMSLESRVRQNTPPTLMFCTEDDKTVPVENTLMFYAALRHAGVDAELHLWPHGVHGFGMNPNIGRAIVWPDLCEDWLRSGGWLTPLKP